MSRPRDTARIRITATLTAGMVLGLSLTALAHVGLEPSEVSDGAGTTISFRIGHGCEGQPTDTVSVRIPAGVASVRPFPKPGWDLEIERGTLPEPIESDDQQITEGVTTVTWSGGSLEDAHTDVFQIRATVYGDAGDRVFFPVVQACGSVEHAWIEIPTDGSDGHDLEEPAPSLVIASDSEEDGSSGTDPLTILAVALSVMALSIGAAALASARNRDSEEE